MIFLHNLLTCAEWAAFVLVLWLAVAAFIALGKEKDDPRLSVMFMLSFLIFAALAAAMWLTLLG